MLKDGETLGKIISGVINGFTLNLLNYWNQIMKDLSSIDLTNFKYYTLLVNATGEAIKAENVKPISLGGLLASLRDPDVQRGLGLIISVLRHLGRIYSSESK